MTPEDFRIEVDRGWPGNEGAACVKVYEVATNQLVMFQWLRVEVSPTQEQK